MHSPLTRDPGASPNASRTANPNAPGLSAADAAQPDAPARPAGPTTLRAMPLWPLAATLAVQTLATMALLSLPAAAPEVARDLHVPGTLIGTFVSLVYTVGIVSALRLAGLIHRHGAVRASQVVLLSVVAMLLISATGHRGGAGGRRGAAGAELWRQRAGRHASAGAADAAAGVQHGDVAAPDRRAAGRRAGLADPAADHASRPAGASPCWRRWCRRCCCAWRCMESARGAGMPTRDPRRRLPGLRGLLAPFRLLRDDARLIRAVDRQLPVLRHRSSASWRS